MTLQQNEVNTSWFFGILYSLSIQRCHTKVFKSSSNEVSFWLSIIIISLVLMSLKQNRLKSLVLDWKTILIKAHYGKWFFIQLCSCFLTKKIKNLETMSNCFFIDRILNSLSYIKFLKKLFYAFIKELKNGYLLSAFISSWNFYHKRK